MLISHSNVYESLKHLFEFRSLFEALDTNDDQQVSFEEIEKGDMEAWKRFCRSRESSSGPTRYF